MKSTPYWMPSRSLPGTSSGHGVHRAGADGDRVEPLLELLEGDVAPDARVVAEGHAEPLDQARVHLDGLAREAEGRHADEHRAAGVGQLVEDRDLVAGDGQLARDRQTGRAGADDRDGRVARRDERHVVGDAALLVPLDEEALHGPDGERPVDVAAAAGPLARGRADVGAHRRDRVGLAREDVALLEAAFSGEVQVAAAVRPDRAGFLALDVALQPGGVDGLDEEFLVGVDDHARPALLDGASKRQARTHGVRPYRIYQRRVRHEREHARDRADAERYRFRSGPDLRLRYQVFDTPVPWTDGRRHRLRPDWVCPRALGRRSALWCGTRSPGGLRGRSPARSRSSTSADGGPPRGRRGDRGRRPTSPQGAQGARPSRLQRRGPDRRWRRREGGGGSAMGPRRGRHQP